MDLNPNEDRTPEKGQRIGSFQVVKILGTGGMGEVLLVYDPRLDRHVAMKRILGSHAESQQAQQRFLREARAAAKLNHPNMVQIHDIFTDDSGLCIVMEWVEGHTLAELLKRGAFDEAEGIRIAKAITSALIEAHRKGVIHRDLKPENVMLTAEGAVKVLDFGLAKQLALPDDALTRTGQILGTTRAMSPEQARGDVLDPRSDLFSLGVLLYELFTGVSPFVGENMLQTLTRIQRVKQKPLNELQPQLQPDLAKLVDWLLEKKPEDRPASAPVFMEAMKDLEAGLFSEATAPMITPVKASQSAKPKFRNLLWLLGIGLLALGAFGIFKTATKPSEQPAIRVALAPPTFDEEDFDQALTAFSVQQAVLDGLLNLTKVAPMSPDALRGVKGNLQEKASVLGADEILQTYILKDGYFSRIRFSRLNVKTGVMTGAQMLQIPNHPSEALAAAEAIKRHIAQVYKPYQQRAGIYKLEVQDADYAAFLKINHDLATDRRVFDAAVETELMALLDSSPNFQPALAQLCGNSLAQFNNAGDPKYLKRAERYLGTMISIAAEDPRTLKLQARVLMAKKAYAAAEDVLQTLARVEPLGLDGFLLASRLAEQQGNLNRAIDLLNQALAKRLDTRLLNRLINLEIQMGLRTEAKKHLTQLLELNPGDVWAMSTLATSELVYGDLARAEQLFQDVAQLLPHKSFFANLGTARFYRGRFEEARVAYQKALLLEPNDASLHLGMADTYFALGQETEARAFYQKSLDLLAEKEAQTALGSFDKLTRALCFAQLGRFDKAANLTLAVLQENPDHGEVFFQAGLVYALANEPKASLACLEKALEKGIQKRWLESPLFQNLEKEPRFQKILSGS